MPNPKTPKHPKKIKKQANYKNNQAIPLFPMPTTLWDHTSQNYGETKQGDTNYIGATPSYVIWNLINRYTKEGEVLMDPFCGSGTSLDVAKDLNRQGIGFDIQPSRDDIQKADARSLPLENESMHMVFMDPPYSNHIHYSEEKECIGKLSAFSTDYFSAMEKAIQESHRVLKKGRHYCLYVCDFFTKKEGLAPVGFKLFQMASQLYTPVDIISVKRRNKDLAMGNHVKKAIEENFFLRGFNYLFIFKKTFT